MRHIPKSFPGTQGKWQHSSVRFQNLRPRLSACPPLPLPQGSPGPSQKAYLCLSPLQPLRALPGRPWAPHLPCQVPTTASLPESNSLK